MGLVLFCFARGKERKCFCCSAVLSRDDGLESKKIWGGALVTPPHQWCKVDPLSWPVYEPWWWFWALRGVALAASPLSYRIRLVHRDSGSVPLHPDSARD